VIHSGRPCPPFKLVILDEADAMTGAAQSALRRTMEVETKSTRFCLLCNYLSRIIAPLTSRCSKFRFKPLSKVKFEKFVNLQLLGLNTNTDKRISINFMQSEDEMILTRLELICGEENVKFRDGVLKALIKTSEGDLRRAITSLQSCFRLKGKDHVLTVKDVQEVSGVSTLYSFGRHFLANYLAIVFKYL
jgi:replication factor C subunit 2/4